MALIFICGQLIARMCNTFYGVTCIFDSIVASFLVLYGIFNFYSHAGINRLYSSTAHLGICDYRFGQNFVCKSFAIVRLLNSSFFPLITNFTFNLSTYIIIQETNKLHNIQFIICMLSLAILLICTLYWISKGISVLGNMLMDG